MCSISFDAALRINLVFALRLENLPHLLEELLEFGVPLQPQPGLTKYSTYF